MFTYSFDQHLLYLRQAIGECERVLSAFFIQMHLEPLRFHHYKHGFLKILRNWSKIYAVVKYY